MKKLWSLLLFLSCYIASATTLTGTLNNPNGTGFTGTLYLSIAEQVGISSLGSCGGPILVVPTTVVAISVNNGAMAGTPVVYGSDCTLPAGMPYNAVLKDVNGNTMFATQWLITGTTQNVGTVYQSPSPIPPTAALLVYGIGSPGTAACSAQSMYVQTNASGGAYLAPCINGEYSFQGTGGGGGGGDLAIGSSITGATANSVLFADGSSNLGQDNSNYNYNSTTHVLTVVQPIVASITGNAGTANSLSVTPSLCTGTQVAVGVAANGNASCIQLTYADIGSPPGSFPVSSVFARTGAITAQTGDYSFSQISGTVSSAQLAGSGAVGYPSAGIPSSTGSAWGTVYSTTGSGTVIPLATSPTIMTPTLSGNTTAGTINGTTIPSAVTLMATTTVLLSGQMPTFTGDVTNSGLAMTVKAINNVPLCTGATPTAGYTLSYTTGGTPNPCYTFANATGVTLKTNTVTNGLQTLLNLSNGPGIQVTQDNVGDVYFTCTGCTGAIPAGITQGIDWPPTTAPAMNDEFTSATFNTSNIWTVVNQNSSTITDSYSLLSVNVPASASNNFVGIYQANPSTPYAVEAKIRLTGVNATAYYGGLAFRDSGTGKVVSFRIGNGATLTVDHWSSPTTLASTVYTQAMDGQPEYFEVEDNGTNFLFLISKDGVNFLQVYSESRTAYLASPGQVGYMCGSANSSYGMALGSDWFRRVL